MVTYEDFVNGVNEYTTLYNELTSVNTFKRNWPDAALRVLYDIYKNEHERGDWNPVPQNGGKEMFNPDTPKEIAIYYVDAWLFVTSSELNNILQDALDSEENPERLTKKDIKEMLNEHLYLFKCKGGWVLNAEEFVSPRWFNNYEWYSGTMLSTGEDWTSHLPVT